MSHRCVGAPCEKEEDGDKEVRGCDSGGGCALLGRHRPATSRSDVWLSDRCVYALLAALYTHRHPHFLHYYQHLHHRRGTVDFSWVGGEHEPLCDWGSDGVDGGARVVSRVRRVLLALAWAKEQRGRLDMHLVCHVAMEAAVWLTAEECPCAAADGAMCDKQEPRQHQQQQQQQQQKKHRKQQQTQRRCLPLRLRHGLRQRCLALRAEYAPDWWAQAAQQMRMSAPVCRTGMPVESWGVHRESDARAAGAEASTGTAAPDAVSEDGAAWAFRRVFVEHESLTHRVVCCSSFLYRRQAVLPLAPDSLSRLLACTTLCQMRCRAGGGGAWGAGRGEQQSAAAAHRRLQRRVQWLGLVQQGMPGGDVSP